MKRTVEADKKESEKKIKEALAQVGGTLTWSDLLKRSQLSSRTLSLRLKELEKKGVVKRIVDTSSRTYPPPVLYELTDLGKEEIETMIFLFSASTLSWINHYFTKGRSDKETLFKMSEEELLEALGKKIGALALYTLVKRVETGQPWMRAVSEYFTQPGGAQALLWRYVVYSVPLKEDPGKLWNSPLGEKNEYQEKLKTLHEALRKVYPEEVQILDRVYARPWELPDGWYIGFIDDKGNKWRFDEEGKPKLLKTVATTTPKAGEEYRRVQRTRTEAMTPHEYPPWAKVGDKFIEVQIKKRGVWNLSSFKRPKPPKQ